MKWVFLLMCLTGCGAVKQKRLDREAAALEETAQAQLVKEAADEMAKRAEAERILTAEIEQEQRRIHKPKYASLYPSP